jgi:rare lipoprotein A
VRLQGGESHRRLAWPWPQGRWRGNSFASSNSPFQRDDVKRFTGTTPLALAATFAVALSPIVGSARAAARQHRHTPQRVGGRAEPDLSARQRLGKASYYARQFFGRPMADGTPMNPRGNNAASRTLPLGTVAKVTDVATGKSAIVKIQDRGPYIKGRIVDLSPSTARKIGITPHIGVAKVVVAPLAVPLPDGRVKLGPPEHPPSSRGIASSPQRNSQKQRRPREDGRSAHGTLAQRAAPSSVHAGS